MTAIWQGIGSQRTGISCPDCPHDWCHHEESGCRFLLGGMDGYELCGCSTPLPPDIVVPTIRSGVLRRGDETIGWQLKHSGRWVVRHDGSTYLVADYKAAVAVMLGEHLARQAGAYDNLILEALP